MTELLDLGKNTPIHTVLRRTVEGIHSPISLEELTINVLETWSRSFSQTPYDNICLVYKLLGTFIPTQFHYDDLGGPPMVPITPGSEDLIPLSPTMPYLELACHTDILKKIKVSSPNPKAGGKKH